LVNGLLKHTVSNSEGELNQIPLCTIIHSGDKNAVQKYVTHSRTHKKLV